MKPYLFLCCAIALCLFLSCKEENEGPYVVSPNVHVVEIPLTDTQSKDILAQHTDIKLEDDGLGIRDVYRIKSNDYTLNTTVNGVEVPTRFRYDAETMEIAYLLLSKEKPLNKSFLQIVIRTNLARVDSYTQKVSHFVCKLKMPGVWAEEEQVIEFEREMPTGRCISIKRNGKIAKTVGQRNLRLEE